MTIKYIGYTTIADSKMLYLLFKHSLPTVPLL